MSLEKYRQNIDEIDNQIVSLLKKRFKVVEDIATYKKEHKLEIVDKGREARIIKDKLTLAKKHDISDAFMENFFEMIFAESREIQSKSTIWK